MPSNPTELEAVLEQVREHYLATYRGAIARYRKRFEHSAAEVLLEVGRDTPLVYRYYRVDLASGATDPPNFTEVNPPAHLKFEPFRCEHAGMSISLSPLVWNGVEFDVEPALLDDSTLQAWALAWIDPDERSPVTVRHSPSIRDPVAALNCQRCWRAESSDAAGGCRGVYRGWWAGA